MGNVQIKKFRRRLVLGEPYETLMDTWLKNDPEAQRLAFRPFGGWNYSYDKSWMRNASFSQWVFATVATLGVDWREAAIVLGGSVLAQETVKKKGFNLFKENDEGEWLAMGASWVFNVQLGYLVYHVLFKRNKRWLVWWHRATSGLPTSYVFHRFGGSSAIISTRRGSLWASRPRSFWTLCSKKRRLYCRLVEP